MEKSKNWNEIIQELVELTKNQVEDRKRAIAVHIPCSLSGKHSLQKDLERKSQEFNRWSRELLLELDAFERKAKESTLRVKADLEDKFKALRLYIENIELTLNDAIDVMESERKYG